MGKEDPVKHSVFPTLHIHIQHRAIPVSVPTSRNEENLKFLFFICIVYSPKGEWADPGGTAIPGQPVGKSEQAPVSSPKFKNQFNIIDPRWGSYQILS